MNEEEEKEEGDSLYDFPKDVGNWEGSMMSSIWLSSVIVEGGRGSILTFGCGGTIESSSRGGGCCCWRGVICCGICGNGGWMGCGSKPIKGKEGGGYFKALNNCWTP